VVAYAVDDAFHGARFRLSDGKLLDATVLDISSVVARYRLMVAVLPGVHAEPGDVTYR
jgi:hypothetical protein